MTKTKIPANTLYDCPSMDELQKVAAWLIEPDGAFIDQDAAHRVSAFLTFLAKVEAQDSGPRSTSPEAQYQRMAIRALNTINAAMSGLNNGLRDVLATRDKELRALREQIMPFDAFATAFADELVKQFGAEVDKDGDSVRDYAAGAADGYYDDPGMWEDGKIDPAYCADCDLQYREG